MKTPLVIAAAVLQVVVLGCVAIEREWVLHRGAPVYLRTAPIDPRDMMRGDYVRLDYDISHVARDLWRDGLVITNRDQPWPRDRRVYASLKLKNDGVAELVSLSDQRPKEGLFIRGRVMPSPDRSSMWVRYGVEAFFTQQGKAIELERGRSRADGIQVPMEMEVALSRGGLAVLKGQRWSPLGIGVELDNAAFTRTNRGSRRPAQGATVRLLNNSDHDIAIVDLPGGRSLALASETRWGGEPSPWVHQGEPPPKPEPSQVLVLKPGQSHSMRVDFTDPYWYVLPRQSKAAAPLSQLTNSWGQQFRLVYRPPDAAACADLPNPKLIWHGHLPSRAFMPMGRVD